MLQNISQYTYYKTRVLHKGFYLVALTRYTCFATRLKILARLNWLKHVLEMSHICKNLNKRIKCIIMI